MYMHICVYVHMYMYVCTCLYVCIGVASVLRKANMISVRPGYRSFLLSGQDSDDDQDQKIHTCIHTYIHITYLFMYIYISSRVCVCIYIHRDISARPVYTSFLLDGQDSEDGQD